MKTASSTTTSLIACAAIVGAFAFGFATGPAFAQEATATAGETQPFKFQFSYQANELTSAPSAEKLLVRLQQDVRAYCGGNRKMSLNEREQVNACIDATMRQSIDKFGSTVAQAYQSRTRG
jgi:UrcA family protein